MLNTVTELDQVFRWSAEQALKQGEMGDLPAGLKDAICLVQYALRDKPWQKDDDWWAGDILNGIFNAVIAKPSTLRCSLRTAEFVADLHLAMSRCLPCALPRELLGIALEYGGVEDLVTYMQGTDGQTYLVGLPELAERYGVVLHVCVSVCEKTSETEQADDDVDAETRPEGSLPRHSNAGGR